jgi:hypothetical protein
MPKGDMKPLRPWRELARRVTEENDADKSLELAEELIRALDAESRRGMERMTPETKAEGAA